MNKAIETMLAASVILIGAGTSALIAEKLLVGAVLMTVGVGLIFVRGYIKFQ